MKAVEMAYSSVKKILGDVLHTLATPSLAGRSVSNGTSFVVSSDRSDSPSADEVDDFFR
jgi:hypothetical protein